MSKGNLLLKEYLRLLVSESAPGAPPPAAAPIMLSGPFQPMKKGSTIEFTVDLDLNIGMTPELASALGIKPEDAADYEGEGEWTIGFDYSGRWSGKHRPQTLWDPAEYPDFDLENLEVVSIAAGGPPVMLTAEDGKTLLHSIETDKQAYAKVDQAIMDSEEAKAHDDGPDPDDFDFDDSY